MLDIPRAQEEFEDIKGVIRICKSTVSTMAKRKRTNNDLQNIHVITNYAPLLADLFIHAYEPYFLQGLLMNKYRQLAPTLNPSCLLNCSHVFSCISSI